MLARFYVKGMFKTCGKLRMVSWFKRVAWCVKYSADFRWFFGSSRNWEHEGRITGDVSSRSAFLPSIGRAVGACSLTRITSGVARGWYESGLWPTIWHCYNNAFAWDQERGIAGCPILQFRTQSCREPLRPSPKYGMLFLSGKQF